MLATVCGANDSSSVRSLEPQLGRRSSWERGQTASPGIEGVGAQRASPVSSGLGNLSFHWLLLILHHLGPPPASHLGLCSYYYYTAHKSTMLAAAQRHVLVNLDSCFVDRPPPPFFLGWCGTEGRAGGCFSLYSVFSCWRKYGYLASGNY